MIVSSCHHCDEQHFHIAVICTLHKFDSCRKLDLFIRALLLDYILNLKKLRVRPTYILL